MRSKGRFLATTAAGIVVLALALVLTGIALHILYRPTLAEAYGSVRSLKGGTIVWQAVSRFHYWGGQILLFVSFLQIVVMVISGHYRKEDLWRWYAMLIIFGCSFTWCVTGNLLPFDRHGVQSVVIEAGVAARTPLVGEEVRATMLQGSQFSQSTLLGWYFVHRWVLPLAFLVGIIGAIAARARSTDTRENKIGIWWPVCVAILCACVWAAPTGPGATASDYDTFLARPNWYAWPMHGSMRLFDGMNPSIGWIGSALIPGLFALFLFALPFIGAKAANMLVNVGFFGFVLFFAYAGYFHGHDFAPLTGWRDPNSGAPKTFGTTSDAKTSIDKPLALEGARVFDKNKCQNCHVLARKGERVGPALDGIGNRIRDREWMSRFIKNPAAIRKGSTMPGFPNLSKDELQALVEFLASQK